MQNLRKVVVITGAGSGIGKALALQLAQQSITLVLVEYNEKRLEQLEEAIGELTPHFSTHFTDISQEDSIATLVSEVVNLHGKVDILINNAGVALGRMEFEEISLDNWEWIMKVNFWGQIYCTQHFLPHLRRQKQGHIVNIGSIYSFVAAKNRAAYVASKFALRGFSESLRQELSDTNVALTIVVPGMVSTNITRHGRGWKSPQEQAQAAYVLRTKAPTSPEKAARKIIKCLDSRQRFLLIGPDSKILYWMSRILPNDYDKIINFFTTRLEKTLGKRMQHATKSTQRAPILDPIPVEKEK